MNITAFGLSGAVAISALAVVGYFVILRKRKAVAIASHDVLYEMKRANAVIGELERIAQNVRMRLATHHASVLHFKRRVEELSKRQDDSAWSELDVETEKLLEPTKRLASQVAIAYDALRQQNNQLLQFKSGTTDPLTGLRNRRSVEESLENLFDTNSEGTQDFAMAIIAVDQYKQLLEIGGEREAKQAIKNVAKLLNNASSQSDVVSRFAADEFAVVLRDTDAAGMSQYCDRVCSLIEQESGLTVSIGTSTVSSDDTARTMIARSEAAQYMASSSGGNCVYEHNGNEICDAAENAVNEQPSTEEASPMGVAPPNFAAHSEYTLTTSRQN